jgi:non-specific protein-tyrosine kinase
MAGLKKIMPGGSSAGNSALDNTPHTRPAQEIHPHAEVSPRRDQQGLDAVAQVRPVDSEKIGWFSPSYSNSRKVKLNPQVLAENRCVGYQSDSPELEYYRVLRTHILQQTGGHGNTVMVTSANPGEGKTLTAINLAFTFAREFKQTALLVDCDLRRQQIHERLGFASDKGLVDYLIKDAPFPDLMVWPGVEKLTVISGGTTVLDSSELLGSLGMKNLVADMKHRYPERYVFFDAPPLLTSADSLAFAPLVDYVLIVVQAGKTSLQDVNRALKLLPSEKILGLVMNRQQNMM